MALSQSQLKKLEKKLEERKSLTSDKNYLKDIDFTDTEIDVESLDSIQRFVQKSGLRLYLNQLKTAFKYQDAYEKGLIKSIPDDISKVLDKYLQMLDRVSGLSRIKAVDPVIKVIVDFGGNEPKNLDLSAPDPESKKVP